MRHLQAYVCNARRKVAKNSVWFKHTADVISRISFRMSANFSLRFHRKNILRQNTIEGRKKFFLYLHMFLLCFWQCDFTTSTVLILLFTIKPYKNNFEWTNKQKQKILLLHSKFFVKLTLCFLGSTWWNKCFVFFC